MDVQVDGMHGYRVELRLLPMASGDAYMAEVVVRQLPSLSEVFEDRLTAGGPGWALPQQALAAALARGRQYVCERACHAPPNDDPMSPPRRVPVERG
jgi:hypothetical protein